jgi:hypothetical protein
MDDDPITTLGGIRAVVAAAREGAAEREQLLHALAALRLLRDELSAWEPELISAARSNGISWTALAPALGVASRQAAERRYLRLQPSDTGETTGEGRVDARRDKRAGDRAVAEWARRNAGSLRKLAGQVSALDGLGATAQNSADRVGDALGTDDPADLLSPLAATHPHVAGHHQGLADQLTAIAEHTDRLRRDAANQRRTQR